MTAATVTRALHTRSALVASCMIVAAMAVAALATTGTDATFTTEGFVGKWSGTWLIDPRISTATAFALNIGVVALIVHLNKYFNLLRSTTKLQGTMFMVMQLATPAFVLCAGAGTLMCLVVMLCVWILYRLYGSGPYDRRSVFLVFALLSAAASFDYTYALYVPVMMAVCVQMRIFSLRTFIAAWLGVLTPWILLLGFGVVSPAELQLPKTAIWLTEISSPDTTVLVATAAFTLFVTLGALVQNVFKIMTYNARSRALLNVLTTLTLATMLAVAVNSANIPGYLPLLNCCAAMQIAHLFGAIHTFAKSYVAILSIVLIYLFILTWKIVISLIL